MEKSLREKFSDQLAIVAIAFGLIVLVAAIVVFWQDIALVPVAFLIAFASGGVGSVLGFLFGIPKMADGTTEGDLTGNAAVSAAAHVASQKLLFNTNLGQVSDWVTKIVIGLGIAQFGQILDGAQWLGGQYADVFDQGLSPEAAATFGLGITISAATFSFMLAYLWTSTRLPDVWKQSPPGE